MSLEFGVKFCGVMSEQDIIKASAVGASAVGTIVRPEAAYGLRDPDGHSIDVGRAAQLIETAPDHLEFVVVPKTDDYDAIVAMTEDIWPDRLQLGETEDPALTARLRKRYEGEIDLAQTIHVDEETRAEVVVPFMEYVDFIHLDSAVDGRAGGTGRTHDWQKSGAIAEYVRAESAARIILAGGLTAGNVTRAIAIVRPDGVDAESANRKHDVYNQKMMERFVDAAV